MVMTGKAHCITSLFLSLTILDECILYKVYIYNTLIYIVKNNINLCKQCALPLITIVAVWQLLHLGRSYVRLRIEELYT